MKQDPMRDALKSKAQKLAGGFDFNQRSGNEIPSWANKPSPGVDPDKSREERGLAPEIGEDPALEAPEMQEGEEMDSDLAHKKEEISILKQILGALGGGQGRAPMGLEERAKAGMSAKIKSSEIPKV